MLQELLTLQETLTKRRSIDADLEHCRASHRVFSNRFFKISEGEDFIEGPHHKLICDAVDRVVRGECKRLLINVPPGYTKTAMAVILFVARGLMINPGARFIHSSYSDKLVLDNSGRIKSLVQHAEYQNLLSVEVKDDTRAKGLWRTSNDGGLLAAPAGGSITGFRAGRMEPGFGGALIIDDPLKPDDARSTPTRVGINARWANTFRSRLANEDVPVIVIMQRLHTDDFSAHLLKESGEHWDHLLLPVEINNAAEYPADYIYGHPIPHGLPDGPLWAAKHNATEIETLRFDSHVFAGQYAQRPTPDGGAVFKEDHLQNRWRDLPPLTHRIIYGDTAQKTKEHNDYSVFQCWGKSRFDGKAVLVDQVRGKWEAPELLAVAKAFWDKHRDLNVYPANTTGSLREMAIEDKVSGTGLIQSLTRDGIPIRGIPREKDKLTRALDVIPQFAIGNVVFPANVTWWASYQDEILSFTGNGDTHDDQVDPTMDAVNELLVSGASMMDVI